MAAPDAHRITVAIERRLDPARTAGATSWMQAATDLAAGFTGFLGSGWVRAGEDSDLWDMLCRFGDIPTLSAWEQSPQRAWWLDSGRTCAHEVRMEGRTGIEGWFDAAFATDVDPRHPRGGQATTTGPIQQPVPPAPPRWKQAGAIWLGLPWVTRMLRPWLQRSA